MFTRFRIIWGEKWTKNFEDDSLQLAMAEWSQAINGIDEQIMEKAIIECKMNLEWPPSIAEFIGICEKQCGVPTWEEIIQLAIRRDFSHPIVKMVYEKVGSWNFANNTEKELREKVKSAYADCLRASRLKLIEGGK